MLHTFTCRPMCTHVYYPRTFVEITIKKRRQFAVHLCICMHRIMIYVRMPHIMVKYIVFDIHILIPKQYWSIDKVTCICTNFKKCFNRLITYLTYDSAISTLPNCSVLWIRIYTHVHAIESGWRPNHGSYYIRTADLMTVYFALASTISLPPAHLICVN
jgi:hypothetical protein